MQTPSATSRCSIGLAVLFASAFLWGCGSSSGGNGNSGLPDSSVTPSQDSGGNDATLSNDTSESFDTSPPDTSTVKMVDSSTRETSLAEASTGEGGAPDGGEAGPSDSGATDGPTSEAGSPEGGIPATCSEANSIVGCCAPNGVNYFCATAGATMVMSAMCPSGQVCGWSVMDMDYECVAPPATSDPSGVNPIACMAGAVTDAGMPDSSVPADGGAGSIPTTCAEADDTVGCCGPNGENYYCSTNGTTVTAKQCTGGKVCGWNATSSYYGCVTGPASSDPSGTYPIACQ